MEEGPIVETIYVSEKEEEYLGQVISIFICFFPCLNGLIDFKGHSRDKVSTLCILAKKHDNLVLGKFKSHVFL